MRIPSHIAFKINGYSLATGVAKLATYVCLPTESCFVKALFLRVDVSNEVTNPIVRYHGNRLQLLSACYHSDL